MNNCLLVFNKYWIEMLVIWEVTKKSEKWNFVTEPSLPHPCFWKYYFCTLKQSKGKVNFSVKADILPLNFSKIPRMSFKLLSFMNLFAWLKIFLMLSVKLISTWYSQNTLCSPLKFLPKNSRVGPFHSRANLKLWISHKHQT